MGEKIEKVSIIVSEGSLEGIAIPVSSWPTARGQRGLTQTSFSPFRSRCGPRQEAGTHQGGGSRQSGMHMASLIGVLPGMSAIATHVIEKKMEQIDMV